MLLGMTQLRWMRIDQASIVDCCRRRLRRQLFLLWNNASKGNRKPDPATPPPPALSPLYSATVATHPTDFEIVQHTQTRQINKYKMLKCRYKMHSVKCRKPMGKQNKNKYE